ncbi:sigma-70 family RNA polymerase sigma factor [Colwellia sp. KU-HH00111]|uniref:sigma-70 family RNA polymerase sigma factor n=1 Tax=Colwellia sp. KU-HH00111 TaxID=3127652 RepID=UPI0031034647
MKKQTSAIVDDANEKKLIDGLLENDDLAYETLVRQYSTRMYAVARRFFNNDDDAQECLQKAFIQVFKNILSFKKDSSLMTWLHRITVNEALMMIRQKKRQKTMSLESFAQHYNVYGERTDFTNDEGGELGRFIENNIETLFEKNETKISLNEIIYQLPEKYCNVLLLRDIQEISTRETAELLAITETSVKTQLHRARLLLKAILEQHDKESLENNWKVN